MAFNSFGDAVKAVKNYILPPASQRMRSAVSVLDFTIQQEYIYDLSYAANAGNEMVVQSVTIDNSDNDDELIFTVDKTLKFTRKIKAGELRTFAVPAIDPGYFTVVSTGTGIAKIYFYNFPSIPESQWLDPMPVSHPSFYGIETNTGNTSLGIGIPNSLPAAADDSDAPLISLIKRLLGKIPAKAGESVPVSPLPGSIFGVSASVRNCVGRQTLAVTTGAVATLTVPVGAVACYVQADGAALSVTMDGATNPTAVIGMRIDDGIIMAIDSSLANVKLIARVANCNAQIAYFDRA